MRTILLVLCALALPSLAGGQTVPGNVVAEGPGTEADGSQDGSLEPLLGHRLRLTSGGQRRVGILVDERLDAFVLRLEKDGILLVVPLDAVERMEVSRGTQSRVVRGAVLGGVAGGVPVFLVGLAVTSDAGWLAPSFGDVARTTAVTAAIGATVGAAIGASSRSDRWETVRGPGAAVSIAPEAGGGVRFTLVVSARRTR